MALGKALAQASGQADEQTPVLSELWRPVSELTSFYSGGRIGVAKDGRSLFCLFSEDLALKRQQYTLFSGDDEGEIRVYDLLGDGGKAKQQALKQHLGQVTDIVAYGDNEFASVGRDAVLVFWKMNFDAEGEHFVKHLKTLPIYETVEGAAVARVGSSACVATVGDKGLVRLWDVEKKSLSLSKAAPHGVQGGMRAVVGLGVGDGTYGNSFVTAGEDHNLIFWDLEAEAVPGSEKSVEAETSASKKKGKKGRKKTAPQEQEPAPPTSAENRGAAHHRFALRQVARYMGHNEEILSTEFLPAFADDEYSSPLEVLVTNSDEIPKLIDPASFAVKKALLGHSDVVVAACVHKNGELIATGSKDNSIRLWDRVTGTCLAAMKGHTHSVLSLCFPNVDASCVLSGSEDKSIKLWRWKDNESYDKELFLQTQRELDFVITSSSAGATSSTCTSTGATLGSSKTTSSSSSTSSSAAGHTAKSKAAITAALDKNLPLACSSEITKIAHDKEVSVLAFGPRGDKVFASGGQDKVIKYWSFPACELLGEMHGHRRGIWCLAFHRTEKVLASGSGDGTIRIWNLNDMKAVKQFEGHAGAVLQLQFLPNQMQLVSAAADGLLKLWHVRTTDCAQTMDKHEGKVWGMDWWVCSEADYWGGARDGFKNGNGLLGKLLLCDEDGGDVEGTGLTAKEAYLQEQEKILSAGDVGGAEAANSASSAKNKKRKQKAASATSSTPAESEATPARIPVEETIMITGGDRLVLWKDCTQEVLESKMKEEAENRIDQAEIKALVSEEKYAKALSHCLRLNRPGNMVEIFAKLGLRHAEEVLMEEEESAYLKRIGKTKEQVLKMQESMRTGGGKAAGSGSGTSSSGGKNDAELRGTIDCNTVEDQTDAAASAEADENASNDDQNAEQMEINAPEGGADVDADLALLGEDDDDDAIVDAVVVDPAAIFGKKFKPRPEGAERTPEFDMHAWLRKLTEKEVESIVDFIARWNCNAKTALLANQVLRELLRCKERSELVKIENFNQVAKSITAYAPRHQARWQQLLSKTFFVDMLLQSNGFQLVEQRGEAGIVADTARADAERLTHEILYGGTSGSVALNDDEGSPASSETVEGGAAAAINVLDSRHPALHEIVKVARELADSRDEELASATVPVLEDSLEKLQVLTATSAERAKDPGAGDFIADMRAQVCAQKKDTEREKCQAFMDGYCARADKAGGAACKAFMGGEEEEETEEAEEAVEEEEPKKPDVVEEDEDLTKDGADDASTPLIEEDEGEQPKKPKGPPPKELPAQGFEGEGVAHIDGETQTDDWREEFGPGQPDTYSSVCAEHPDNEWCRLHGYYTPKADAAGKHASSTALAVVTAVGSVALGAAGGFLW
eukprot:g13429.t1